MAEQRLTATNARVTMPNGDTLDKASVRVRDGHVIVSTGRRERTTLSEFDDAVVSQLSRQSWQVETPEGTITVDTKNCGCSGRRR